MLWLNSPIIPLFTAFLFLPLMLYISECNQETDVILLSSVLGYLDDTYAQFRRILEQGARYVIIDELAFSSPIVKQNIFSRLPPDAKGEAPFLTLRLLPT